MLWGLVVLIVLAALVALVLAWPRETTPDEVAEYKAYVRSSVHDEYDWHHTTLTLLRKGNSSMGVRWEQERKWAESGERLGWYYIDRRGPVWWLRIGPEGRKARAAISHALDFWERRS